MEEIWRPVVGYEGLYEVSNYGNVRRTKNLRWQVTIFGYARVSLWKNRVQKWKFVHRLVAEAFIPNTENLPEINHKDENKLNNFVYVNPDGSIDPERSNLEWCDKKYNINYGTRNKRLAEVMKRNKYFCKPIKMLSKNGDTIKIFESATDAAKYLGKSIGNICSCANGTFHHKTAYGYKWEWA